MQRSIYSWAGAVGLIFTFTASSYAAAGAASGAVSGGAVASGAAAPAATATAPAARPAATAPAQSSAITPATGTGAGTSVTATPGQSVTATPGQTPASGNPVGIVGQTVNADGQPLQGTTATVPNQTAGTPIAGTAATTANNIATPIGSRSIVPLTSLPASVQAAIANQIPAGAQLGAISAETTASGPIFRAQVMQNGIVSELGLTGIPGAAATANGTLAGATATTTAGFLPATSGFVVGTPFAFDQLPTAVQGAFAAQAGGAAISNLTYNPGSAGGIFRGFANGRPVEVRVAGNGQIIPSTTRIATTTTPRDENEVRLDDVPDAVREAVRASMPFAEVTRIRKSESASGNLYDITLRGEGRSTTMQISENGTVIKETQELPLAISTTAAPTVLTNELPKLAFTTLPSAVRDSIEVQTTRDTVRSVVLTNFQGKTSFAVDYTDRDGLRNRLYVGKDGLIMETQTNLFGISQSGRPVVLGDLPAPARSIVEQQAESAAITRIDLALHGLTPVYVVSYQKDGETRQMVVTREGRRIDSAVGAPAVSATGVVTNSTADSISQ